MPPAFLTPALSTLRDEIDALYPNRSKALDGWIGDAAHAARDSDHNPEEDGSVDAIDITHDPVNGVNCYELAEEIKEDPRLEGGGYIIFDGRIYNPDIADYWRPYFGSNAHRLHMHVSVADRLQNDTSPWLGGEWSMAAEEKLQQLIHIGRAQVKATRRNTTAVIRQNQLNRKADLAREKREAEREGRDTDEIVAELQDIEEQIAATNRDEALEKDEFDIDAPPISTREVPDVASDKEVSNG